MKLHNLDNTIKYDEFTVAVTLTGDCIAVTREYIGHSVTDKTVPVMLSAKPTIAGIFKLDDMHICVAMKTYFYVINLDNMEIKRFTTNFHRIVTEVLLYKGRIFALCRDRKESFWLEIFESNPVNWYDNSSQRKTDVVCTFSTLTDNTTALRILRSQVK